MAAINRRRVAFVVLLVLVVIAGVAWALWRRQPEGAVISVVVVIGSLMSQRDTDLSRWLYLGAGLLIATGLFVAALTESQSGKLTGLLIMVAGVTGGMQVFLIRFSHLPDYPKDADR